MKNFFQMSKSPAWGLCTWDPGDSHWLVHDGREEWDLILLMEQLRQRQWFGGCSYLIGMCMMCEAEQFLRCILWVVSNGPEMWRRYLIALCMMCQVDQWQSWLICDLWVLSNRPEDACWDRLQFYNF